MSMVKYLRRAFCHHTFVLHTKLYGDSINLHSCRELWKCTNCDKIERRRKLQRSRNNVI